MRCVRCSVNHYISSCSRCAACEFPCDAENQWIEFGVIASSCCFFPPVSFAFGFVFSLFRVQPPYLSKSSNRDDLVSIENRRLLRIDVTKYFYHHRWCCVPCATVCEVYSSCRPHVTQCLVFWSRCQVFLFGVVRRVITLRARSSYYRRMCQRAGISVPATCVFMCACIQCDTLAWSAESSWPQRQPRCDCQLPERTPTIPYAGSASCRS